MDDKFTLQLQQYLAADDPDTAEGAELLLRLNHNKFMHARILRHPDYMRPKLMSELRHYLRIRLDGMTRQDIVRMERDVMPRAQESLSEGEPISESKSNTHVEEDVKEVGTESAPDDSEVGDDASSDASDITYRGKRDDHDLLPAKVQAVYERNGEVYRKLKQTFETLKQMSNRPACDRYEYLKQLKALDDEYRNNWEVYDHYQSQVGESITTMVSAATVGDAAPVAAITPNQVSSARKFLSVNHSKLPTVDNEVKRTQLLTKMQERVNLLLSAGQSFDADFQRALEIDGLTFSCQTKQ